MTNPTTPAPKGRMGDFVQDAFALAGAALITYGAEQWYRPAGFVIGGMFLLGSAWLSARKSS